jgi:hypothetical protein
MANDVKTETVPCGAKHLFEMRIPDLTVKWAVTEVLPDNDAKPSDVIALIEADTTYPDNRDKAELKIWAEHKKKTVDRLENLKLAGNKIVNNSDNKRPEKKFSLDDGIWNTWDKLNYHISGSVGAASDDTDVPLKVKRWHVQAINKTERPAILAFRNQESANYDSSFAGCTDDVHHSWTFNAGGSSAANFGKMMRNTYSFNYTGHGNVVCGVCQDVYDGIHSGTDAEFGRFTECKTNPKHNKPISVHCVGPFPWLQRDAIKNRVTTPSTPKYLAYSVCCGGAFETSLFDAYISRGTKFAIGFKKSTRCDWARDYSKQLFDTWIQTHKADPDKIPDTFNSLHATWSTKLEPVLFGKYMGMGSHLRNLGRSIASIF